MGFYENSKVLRELVTLGTSEDSYLSWELAREAVRKPKFLEEAIKAEIVCNQGDEKMNRQLVYVVGLGFGDVVVTEDNKTSWKSKKALFYVGPILDGNIEKALKGVALCDLYGFTPFSNIPGRREGEQ